MLMNPSLKALRCYELSEGVILYHLPAAVNRCMKIFGCFYYDGLPFLSYQRLAGDEKVPSRSEQLT
jgi:hypothetical protein